jgi:hypothetical protein
MLTRPGQARRDLIRSAANGALLTLPLMRMLRDSEARADEKRLPKLVLAYFPTGYKQGQFYPTEEGVIKTLPTVLAPLEDLGLKNDLLMFDGLFFHGSFDHNGGLTQVFAGWGAAGLVPGIGTPFNGSPINGSTFAMVHPRPYSVDQIIADRWKVTPLILGVASSRVFFPDPLSWKKGGLQNYAQDNPKVVFDKMFGSFNPGANEAEARRKLAVAEKRVIDFLIGDLKRVESKLGAEDKAAFQSHLAAIDDINVEINKTIKGTPSDTSSDQCKPDDIKTLIGNRAAGWEYVEDNLPAVFKIQRSIALQVLACNITRIVMWQIGGGHCVTQLRSEGVAVQPDDHHVLSHYAADQASGFAEVQRGHIREIGKLVQSIKATKVQGGSLLDDTLVYVASDSGDTGHTPTRVPSFFLGNMNGRFQTGGRLIRMKDGRGYNQMLVSVAHLMGATDVMEIGNSMYTGPLPELKFT